LTGDEVAGLERWLIDATAQWRDLADQVAKRLVALGVAPDGRVRSLAKDIPTNWVPDGWIQLDDARRLLGDRLSRVSSWARDGRLYAEDPAGQRVAKAAAEKDQHDKAGQRQDRHEVGDMEHGSGEPFSEYGRSAIVVARYRKLITGHGDGPDENQTTVQSGQANPE
jgi:hypothetical protein